MKDEKNTVTAGNNINVNIVSQLTERLSLRAKTAFTEHINR